MPNDMEKRTETLPFQAGRYHLTSNFRIEHYVDMEVMDIERHYHEFYECLFFYSGDITYSVGSREYALVPGDVLLLNIAQIHLPTMRSANPPYDRITLFLDRGFIDKLSDDEVDFVSLFERNDGNLIHLSDEAFWTSKSILSKLSNLYADSAPIYGKNLLARCYITELLLCLGSADAAAAPAGEAHVSLSRRIAQVKDYIAKHLADDLSLDTLAATFHLSKYYLAHEFKKHTGMSLHAYIVKRRLARACDGLRDGCTPAEVCGVCGFSDTNVFGRAFKKEFGLTPKQFVQSLRER